MEHKRSAFKDNIRGLDEHVSLDATDYHIASYVTGGLSRLIHLIQEDKVPQLPEFGYHTNEDGHFSPKGSCLMGLRYEVKKILESKGQSAVLVLAEDLFQENRLVVIKVLHTQFYRLGAQESHVLWKLAISDPLNHSHTLRLLTTFTFDSHYCMVFEPLLPDPLTVIFQEYPGHKVVSNIRKVGLRLLATIGFLHQQDLIHTDLKPDNILLKYENDLDSVHIVDFGNTINYVHSEVSLYYKDFELQTPLYRAPEVMFGVPFGPEIDIWSLGCIFAELYLGKPLLLGNSTEDILNQMYDLLGPFPTKLFRRGKFYKNLKQYTSNEDQVNACTKIFEHLQFTDYLFADLLAGMLRYNPAERLTASEAAQHPFFAAHFPVAFLLSSGRDNKTISSVSLSKQAYQFSPKIAPNIKKGQPTSIDLLRIGTSDIEPVTELEETTILKPSPRYKMKGDHLSLLEEPTQLFSPSNSGTDSLDKYSPQRPVVRGHSDVSVVKNVITERKDRFSDNVKEKMTSLLKAIRQEQDMVECDLDNKFENSRRLTQTLQRDKRTIVESVRPVPKYGAFRENPSTHLTQMKFSCREPSSETKREQNIPFVSPKSDHRRTSVKKETNVVNEEKPSLNTGNIKQGKQSAEQINKRSSQKMTGQEKKYEVSDRTFTHTSKSPCNKLEKQQKNKLNVGSNKTNKTLDRSHSQENIQDSKSGHVNIVAISPGPISNRTNYIPKVLREASDQPVVKTSNNQTINNLVCGKWDRSNNNDDDGEDVKPPSTDWYESKERAQSEGMSTHQKSLRNNSTLGRKRVHSDCLSDEEIIDVLSPMLQKRQRHTIDSPGIKMKRQNIQHRPGREYTTGCSEESIDELSPMPNGSRRQQKQTSDSLGMRGQYLKHSQDIEVTTSPNEEVIDVLSPMLLESTRKRQRHPVDSPGMRTHNIQHELDIEDTTECDEVDNVRNGIHSTERLVDDDRRLLYTDRKNKQQESTRGYRLTQVIDGNLYQGSSNRNNVRSRRDVGLTCDNDNGQETARGQLLPGIRMEESQINKCRYRMDSLGRNKKTVGESQDVVVDRVNREKPFNSKRIQHLQDKMPTPILKYSEPIHNYDDSFIDSPEIVYKTFQEKSKLIKSRPDKHSEDHKINVAISKKASDKHLKGILERERKTSLESKVNKNFSHRPTAGKRTESLTDTGLKEEFEILHQKSQYDQVREHVGNLGHDQFTFLGTPASDLKISGDLAHRIAERSKKLKRKARKSLNFQETDDIENETSDEDDSQVELIEKSKREEIFGHDSGNDFPGIKLNQIRNVRKSSDATAEFHVRDFMERNLSESKTKASGSPNFKRKGNSRTWVTKKSDETFVLDFESPFKPQQGKR